MSTLAEDYLNSRGGSPTTFQNCLTEGQRIGQAFFNALSEKDQERLRGTTRDPFYIEHGPALHKVIEWLLDTENKE